jgi:hypothetical protein
VTCSVHSSPIQALAGRCMTCATCSLCDCRVCCLVARLVLEAAVAHLHRHQGHCNKGRPHLPHHSSNSRAHRRSSSRQEQGAVSKGKAVAQAVQTGGAASQGRGNKGCRQPPAPPPPLCSCRALEGEGTPPSQHCCSYSRRQVSEGMEHCLAEEGPLLPGTPALSSALMLWGLASHYFCGHFTLSQWHPLACQPAVKQWKGTSSP